MIGRGGIDGLGALYRRRVSLTAKTPSILLGQALTPTLWILGCGTSGISRVRSRWQP